MLKKILVATTSMALPMAAHAQASQNRRVEIVIQ